ncbi:hypothetical protein [Vibrio diabolicus]|uniref:hypothetical protein n=1 Tax=Vibrio diabolicus TaxID=50719 RepID=UPI003D7DEEA4
MNLDLYEKQLLRSISDVVVRDPCNAKLVFEMVTGTTDNAAKLMSELEPIIDVVYSYQNDLGGERLSYINDLNSAIEKLSNHEAQVIFRSALEPDLELTSQHSKAFAGY